jgi:Fe-S cluster assembly protein SufD
MSARPSPALTRALEALTDRLPPAQREALEQLVALGLPTPRDDAFRYTNLRLLDRRDLVPTVGAQVLTPTDLPIGQHALVFVNGTLDRERSRVPDGCQWVTEVRSGALPGHAADERIRLLNAALGREQTRLVIARNTQVTLDVVALSSVGGAYPSLLIQVEPGAELRLTEQHAGSDAESVTAATLQIELGDGAIVDHTLLQVSEARAVIIGDVQARVGRDATYRHRSAALGAHLSRFDLTVQLVAPGASTFLSGLFLADGSREHHLRTVVHHQAPNCTSTQVYRGVASERGRGSYDGKVIVDAGANGTNSSQSSKNLLLSADATIETRPQLEINADAVKCAHGATTGSLDETMLFYLLSRGLDRKTARAVLTYAFLGDVLVDFTANTRAFVEQRALGRLPAADLIRGFVA